MPPRYAYWTILVDNQPTAFRAGSMEDLTPTFKRLKEKHPSAVMMWFQNGKLWNSRLDAQEAMQNAALKVAQAKNFRAPSLQEEKEDVQTQVERFDAPPPPDKRVLDWRDRNPWFGPNRGMTAYALGLHEEMRDNGVTVGSDEYYAALDKTMRKRFPEKFGMEGTTTPTKTEAKTSESVTKNTAKVSKPSTVVAPATRSTAPKKVQLTQRQLNLAKKFKLSPEQYARELTKLESQNG